MADVLDDTVNSQRLLLPFVGTMFGLLLLVHAYIVLNGNRITLTATLLLAVVALYYAWFLITRGRRLRQVRFGLLVAHTTAYALVNVGYLLHAGILVVTDNPAVQGDDWLALDPGWFGVTFGMASLWGVGLIVHTVASIAQRGFEERL